MTSKYSLYRVRSISHALLVRIAHKRCAGYARMKPYFEKKAGIEFGGPSSIFSSNHLIPIYNIASSVDNCDFAKQTLWTNRRGRRRPVLNAGKQFVSDGCDVSGRAEGSYDFVVASHVLEHVANPLRALIEWKRLLKPSGTLLLVLPHKAGTFDHRRPFTAFAHVKADYDAMVLEDDLTHMDEILALHDLELDPPAGTPEQFRQRCLQNASNRAMHHHVFNPDLLVEIFTFLQMAVVNLTVERPFHIVVQAQKENRCETNTLH